MTGWAWFWLVMTYIALSCWFFDTVVLRSRRRLDLHEVFTGPGEPRCACGLYWLPGGSPCRVYDETGEHEFARCQPGREQIR